MPLTGSLRLDPQLSLADVVINLSSDGEPVVTASLPLLDSWSLEGALFSAVLPLPQNLVDGVYSVSITVSDGVRTATTPSHTFNYRVPVPLSITLESPANGQAYYSPVNVSGYVTADRTADPMIRAYVQRLDDQASEVELPMNIEGWSFSASIDEPGSYQLTVEAIVNNTHQVESVRFDYVSGNGIYMPLDELVRNELPDLEGINNAGLFAGAAGESFAPGVVGRAVRFDAESYVQIADHSEVNLGDGDFSIFVWVKTSRIGMIQSLVEKRPENVISAPGYTLYLDARGTPSFQMTSVVATGGIDWTNFEVSRTAVPSSFVADGVWHHVGVTVERNAVDGLKLYLDGRVVGVFDPTGHASSLTNDAPLWLGHHVIWPDSYFSGSMDELLLVKRVLPPEEIQKLMGSAAITLPHEGFVRLTSPTAETYSGRVNIAGSYVLDPGLTPDTLEITDGAGASIPLAVEMDSSSAAGEFGVVADCRVFSPGTHELQARLTDSLEQTLLSQLVSFEFRLPEPEVSLELSGDINTGFYIYGRADFSDCPLDSGQSPLIRVFVNERPVDVDVINGQLPEDFIFNVNSEWLRQGENLVLVEVIDPRDSQAIGVARIVVSVEASLSLTIVNPVGDAPLAGHVQVYGHFHNARGPLSLYSELDGRIFMESIPVSGNRTFTFTIPAEMLQEAERHSLYLKAFDQSTPQQTAETKTEFSYKPGGELTPGGDVLAINDMDALWIEENRRWFLNWANFEPGFDSGRKNSVLFAVSEATCKLVDGINGHCARAKVVLNELYQEVGYEFSVVERASLAEIPGHIKVLILFLPDSEFNENEILSIKNFAASGGRVVYVGESHSCPDCYSESAQAQFFQQMGVEIRQEKGFTYYQLYKPNGELHQIASGIEVIGIADAGVFVVGKNVTPLVISEFDQVIAAVAKINTNPYEFIRNGVGSPRQERAF